MVKDKKSRSKSKSKGEAAPVAKREPSPAPSSSSSSSSDVSDSESDYSTTDTEEDDDGAQLTPAMDAAILRTLAKIKKGGEELYAGENVLQSELETARKAAEARGLKTISAKQAEEQPFLLKDLHRQNLLEGVAAESDDEGGEPLTFVEETRRARADAVNAFKAFADDDESEDELLVKREKGADEAEEDDEAYRRFLLEMGGGEDEVRRALGMGPAPMTNYREDSDDEDDFFRAESSTAADADAEKKKDKKEKKAKKKRSAEDKAEARAKADDAFLMDYILNRGWIEKKADKSHVPTYEEIVGHERPDGESGDEDEDAPWGALSEDEEFEDRAEEFETQYNFRFEEPGAAEIISHPRQIESLARRDDDKRKLKREARAERKAAEKAEREAETKRQKGEKRREMEKQLAALREEVGDADVDWTAVEKVLEGEYDEAEWDRVVGEMLAKAAESDDEKPTWDDDGDDYPMDDEEGDGWVEPQAWEETEDWAAGAGDDEDDEGPINMDADFLDEEPAPKKKLSKKEKKKAKKAAAAAAEAGAEEEGDEKLSVAERAARVKAAADSLRSLDHEDAIGDLKTRFKYVKSAPSTFGLTPAEILLATDAELNELVSVKALAPYRRGGLGRAGYGLGRRVRDLKDRLRGRKWGEEPEPEKKGKDKKKGGEGGGANAIPLGKGKAAEGRPGKRLGRKERERLRAAAEGGEGETAVAGEKRKRADEEQSEPAAAKADATEAGGAGDGEKKKKRRKKKKAAAVEA